MPDECESDRETDKQRGRGERTHVRMCVHLVGAHKALEGRGHLSYLFSGAIHFGVGECISLTWSSSRKLGWLTSNPQGPACLCLPIQRVQDHAYRPRLLLCSVVFCILFCFSLGSFFFFFEIVLAGLELPYRPG